MREDDEEDLWREWCERLNKITHDDLVKIAVRWLSRPWRNAGTGGHSSCAVVLSEMTSAVSETPDAIGFHSGCSTLIECKASVSDFKSDKAKRFRREPNMGVGVYRYFMVPTGLLEHETIPDGWGVIEVGETGKTRVSVVSGKFDANVQAEKKMLISLVCRLKVDPGRHIKIRVYKIDDESEPRATAHIREIGASESEGR